MSGGVIRGHTVGRLRVGASGDEHQIVVWIWIGDMTAPGRELLRLLKATACDQGSQLGIPVGTPIKAWLRPVATSIGRTRREDLRVLTEWRNANVTSFLHEFQANEERTARWLTDIVGPDDTKILFMLDDTDGRTFAYMGLAFIDWELGRVEADAVVRGTEAEHGV